MSLNPLQLALDCLLLLLFYYAWKAMSYQACLVAFFIWIIAALFVALLCVMPNLLNSLDEDETELVAPEHLMIVRVMAAATEILVLYIIYIYYRAIRAFKTDSGQLEQTLLKTR